MNWLRFIKKRVYSNEGKKLCEEEIKNSQEGERIQQYCAFIKEMKEVCKRHGYEMGNLYETDKTFYPYPYYGMFNLQFYSKWLGSARDEGMDRLRREVK